MFGRNSRVLELLQRLLPYLDASFPLPDALRLLSRGRSRTATLAKAVLPLVERGYALSLALDILGAPAAWLEWITIGESTGKLGDAIRAFLTLRARHDTLRKTWAELLRYPTLMLLFMGGVLIVFHTTLFPSLARFYGAHPLPPLTEWLFHSPGQAGACLLVIPLFCTVGLWPFRALQRRLALCDAMQLKLDAGIPLLHAAPIAWRPLLAAGYPLSVVLTLHAADAFLVRAVETAEQLGKLSYGFDQARRFYDASRQRYVDRIRHYGPPLVMFLLAGYVSVLVMGIYLPLIRFNVG